MLLHIYSSLLPKASTTFRSILLTSTTWLSTPINSLMQGTIHIWRLPFFRFSGPLSALVMYIIMQQCLPINYGRHMCIFPKGGDYKSRRTLLAWNQAPLQSHEWLSPFHNGVPSPWWAFRYYFHNRSMSTENNFFPTEFQWRERNRGTAFSTLLENIAERYQVNG